MRFLKMVLLSLILAFSAQNAVAESEFNVKASDKNIGSKELYKLIINKKLKFGLKYVNYVIRKGGVIEDRYGNVNTQYRWAIDSGGVFCRLDRQRKNWGVCFDVVRSGDKIIFASEKERYRAWIRDVK